VFINGLRAGQQGGNFRNDSHGGPDRTVAATEGIERKGGQVCIGIGLTRGWAAGIFVDTRKEVYVADGYLNGRVVKFNASTEPS